MTERKVSKTVTGHQTIDGAGVHLVRVLGNNTVKDFDPFLMLDSFDSHNPQDYIAGFPMHPHRGIETITYLVEGEMEHEDSLGNRGRIHSGQSQWMTAGSGIMHQEMPQSVPYMLGFQLWLNLPQKDKMAHPAYFDITEDKIAVVQEDGCTIRVVSGEYGGKSGVKTHYIQATLYDVLLEPAKTVTLATKPEENVFVFLLKGNAIIAGQDIPAKTAVLLGPGDTLTVQAPATTASHFFFFSGKPLHEDIAWGGPIVMNTREELHQAFVELEQGTFIRDNAAQR